MVTYRHSADMGEISGFGNSGEPTGEKYEKTCQDMLEAGVKWIMAREQKPTLRLLTNNQVYGIALPDNDETNDLSNHIVDAAKGEATGAQHHTVMSRLMYINDFGWDEYCEEMREHHRREQEEGEE